MHYKVNRDGFAFAFTKIFFHFIHFILSFFLSSTIAPRGSLSQSLRSRVVCINVRSVSLAFASVFLFFIILLLIKRPRARARLFQPIFYCHCRLSSTSLSFYYFFFSSSSSAFLFSSAMGIDDVSSLSTTSLAAKAVATPRKTSTTISRRFRPQRSVVWPLMMWHSLLLPHCSQSIG